jgi:hypothetical protein
VQSSHRSCLCVQKTVRTFEQGKTRHINYIITHFWKTKEGIVGKPSTFFLAAFCLMQWLSQHLRERCSLKPCPPDFSLSWQLTVMSKVVPATPSLSWRAGFETTWKRSAECWAAHEYPGTLGTKWAQCSTFFFGGCSCVRVVGAEVQRLEFGIRLNELRKTWCRIISPRFPVLPPPPAIVGALPFGWFMIDKGVPQCLVNSATNR